KRFVVTRELVENPPAELQKLLAEHEKEEHVVMRQLLHEFARRFHESHDLKIWFTDAAADRLVALALEQSKPIRDLCAEKLKDFRLGADVDDARRLIHNQDVAFTSEPFGQGDLLLVAPAEAGDERVE